MPRSASVSTASRTARSQPPTVTMPKRRVGLLADDRRGHRLGRGLVLARQAVHHFLVLVGDLGVAAELVVARAAREERALRVHAGQRARRDVVAVLGRVAEELRHRLELGGAEHAAAVRAIASRPSRRRGHDPVVHADVEIGQHEDRRLEALGEIERRHGEVEALGGVRREEQDVLGVAVRRVGARQDVALLRARRHAGRRARALHVDDAPPGSRRSRRGRGARS